MDKQTTDEKQGCGLVISVNWISSSEFGDLGHACNVEKTNLANIPAIIQTSKAPASPIHWNIGQGKSVSWLWSDWSSTVNTRPHRTERTKAEQVNTNTETAKCVRNTTYLPASLILIHPLSRTRFHIINTMTMTLILRPLTGPAGHCIYSPTLQKKARFCFVYTWWVNLQWQRCHYRSDSIQLGLKGGQVTACDHRALPKHQQTSTEHVPQQFPM